MYLNMKMCSTYLMLSIEAVSNECRQVVALGGQDKGFPWIADSTLLKLHAWVQKKAALSMSQP